jgi:hypothetical protein
MGTRHKRKIGMGWVLHLSIGGNLMGPYWELEVNMLGIKEK